MRDLFTKDIGWKLFSLFLATALWLTANRILHERGIPDANSSTSTASYDTLPVTLVSTTGDVHDFHFAPTAVKVTVTGPANVMEKLQQDHVHATINISTNMTRGQFMDVEISVPTQVAVVSIEPDKVWVMPPLPPKD